MIGQTIYNLLSTNSPVTAIVGIKIYPYIMNEATDLPAVIYTVDSLDVDYNKGGQAVDEYTFSVHCFSTDYAQLQSLSSAVRSALELKSTGYGSRAIDRILVEGQTEGFNISENAYHNIINFRVKVKN